MVPLAPRQELQQQGSRTLLLPHFPQKLLRADSSQARRCCGERRCGLDPAGPMPHGTPWLLRGHGWVQSTEAKGIAKPEEHPSLSPLPTGGDEENEPEVPISPGPVHWLSCS